MIYYKGDIHGNGFEITHFCRKNNLKSQDIIVILGDVGANYYLNKRDEKMKHELRLVKPTILCVHGNHECRPENIPTYRTKEWNGGVVWYEEKFPKSLFAKDGEIFKLDGMNHLVIGGAYSVDKHYRIQKGYAWWPDEQPSDETKRYVEEQVKAHHIDVILSHTCPFKYEPVEAFLPMIDQSTVDSNTEHWLDIIEESCDYSAWLCGHWHISKNIDKIHFLYQNFMSSEELKRRFVCDVVEMER